MTKRYVTVVLEYQEGDTPDIGLGSEAFGGLVVAAAAYDAIEVLRMCEELGPQLDGCSFEDLLQEAEAQGLFGLDV